MITTPTQIREAILKAADHIEGNPELYSFWASNVPGRNHACPACMWGRVGWFLGMYGAANMDVAEACGDDNTAILYCMTDGSNPHDPQIAARALRTFADTYFPETETETYPAVQAELERIFAGEVTI